MRNLKWVLTIGFMSLTACQAPDVSSPNSTPLVSTTLQATLPTIDPTSPSNIQLTYFKKTRVGTRSTTPLKTYSATGYCVVYNTQTYCWDDGIATIPSYTYNSNLYGATTYDYFSTMTIVSALIPQGWELCNGACTTDALLVPTPMDSFTTFALTHNSATIISDVFNGTPVSVNCALGNQLLNCGDFVIDLTLAPLGH